MLTDEELDALLYLWWSAPALFGSRELGDEYNPLVEKGCAYVKRESYSCWFNWSVRISQKGQEAVLEDSVIRVIEKLMTNTLTPMYQAVEHFIKLLPMEALPELMGFTLPGTEDSYVRLFAMERMDQLKGEQNMNKRDELYEDEEWEEPEWPEYAKREESDKQKQFREEVTEAGYQFEFYQGRFFYEGWAIRVEGIEGVQEAIRATSVLLQWDTLGKSGYIVYPKD